MMGVEARMPAGVSVPDCFEGVPARAGRFLVQAIAVLCLMVFLIAVFLILERLTPSASGQPSVPALPSLPPTPPLPTGHEEGRVYAWDMPAPGSTQSLVVFKAIDGETVEAAYLVPIRFRVKGADAGRLDTNFLTKTFGGRMLTARIGMGSDHRPEADFWVSKELGWSSERKWVFGPAPAQPAIRVPAKFKE